MIYRVTARPRAEAAAELLARLRDGSIARQRPDGREIVASMHRAVVREDGTAAWSELCYCDPPLAHERATVLDRYFDDIRTEPVEGYETYAGRPLTEWLEAHAGDAPR